jgi:glycosyltransferase involved in cell wall biosynthesis
MPVSNSFANIRIAIVHDWLDTWRGGENVLAEVLAIVPHAELYALVDFLPEALRPRLLGKRAHTSFLQRLPAARRCFRVLLPFFPRAITSLDLSRFDVVISISHAVAKGVRTRPDQLHLCYCLTPMRYAWDLRETYLASAGASAGWRRALADRVLDRLRAWDVARSSEVTRFLAISRYVADRVRRCYARDAYVVYPPVDVVFFTPSEAAAVAGSYVTASHWVPYKRLDLIVDAFRGTPQRRLIVAGGGPELGTVRAGAPPNVRFLGPVSREVLRDTLRAARAFIFAAEEDFGIAPLEAQACGTPVIAFAGGAVVETIRGLDTAEPTGVFFMDQSVASIRGAVAAFEASAGRITAKSCRANAVRFAADLFRESFADYVAVALDDFRASRRLEAKPC